MSAFGEVGRGGFREKSHRRPLSMAPVDLPFAEAAQLGGIAAVAAIAVEGLELWRYVKKNKRVPWRTPNDSPADGELYSSPRLFVSGWAFRAMAAFLLVGLYGLGKQIDTVMAAVTLGVGTDLGITRLADSKDIGTEYSRDPNSLGAPTPRPVEAGDST